MLDQELSRRAFILRGAATVATVAAGASLLPELAGATDQIGTLSIPKLRLNKPIVAGVASADLRRGVGHWPGTAGPGEAGTCVLFGHRTSSGAPFRNLHRLTAGDTMEAGDVTYVVADAQVVPVDEMRDLMDWGRHSGRTLVLVACSRANGRPTSTKFRLVVRAVAS